ncbi:TPA: hypothetical protein DCE37_26430 [Candidatus Latescibacteria bacterium]|nr:hypothetical protein [Candidatus Latescibacterota bacterium]
MLRRLIWVAVSGVFAMGGQVPAQTTDFLFSNRFMGAVSAGAGIYFLAEAKKARDDGSEAYDLYSIASSPTVARELYDESKQNDTKAAIMLGLGVGTITYGVHLLMKGDKDELPDPKMDRGLIEVKGVKVDAGPDPYRGRLGVQLRRSF